MAPLTAFVLAGGQSSRMGTDKALLTLADETLLERALATVAKVATEVRIAGSRVRYEQFGKIVDDIHQACGPLGGIHAALKSSETELNFVLSVDMPRMSSEFLRWLVAVAEQEEALITVPKTGEGFQPLCAVYRKSAADAVERAIQSGDYKVSRLFQQVPTRVITEAEITAAGFPVTLFHNVNTPKEFQQLANAGDDTK